MNRLTVEETNLLSIYRTGSRQGLIVAMKDDTEPKEPLSPTQEASFLSFVQSDKVYQKYCDEIIILLWTGLRISELCGLTEADIDFENKLINVDHQLLKHSEADGYYIETPKTKSGTRQIPMSTKVYEAVERVIKNPERQERSLSLVGTAAFYSLTGTAYQR